MLQPGDAAPDFTLPDLDGSAWSLSGALRNGPVVLAFFKIACPTCQFTFPFLQRLADSPRPGPQMIAISQDDAEDSREFQQRFGIQIPTLIDAAPRFTVSTAYRITNVPTLFVVEADGRIATAVNGFNKAEMEKLGHRYQVIPFRESDHVPALRPG